MIILHTRRTDGYVFISTFIHVRFASQRLKNNIVYWNTEKSASQSKLSGITVTPDIRTLWALDKGY